MVDINKDEDQEILKLRKPKQSLTKYNRKWIIKD
jgi:hypothetical protein